MRTEIALRRIQMIDERVDLGDFRHLAIEAMDALGEELGLTCTGEIDGTNSDGSPAYYSHDGDTCPIHEWMDKGDSIYGPREVEA